FFQAEDGIRDFHVTGVQTCALPISRLVLAGLVAEAVNRHDDLLSRRRKIPERFVMRALRARAHLLRLERREVVGAPAEAEQAHQEKKRSETGHAKGRARGVHMEQRKTG